MRYKSMFGEAVTGKSLMWTGTPDTHACGCVGPQNGQPLCPCAMRGVKIIRGRYVIPERDLGPVAPIDVNRTTPTPDEVKP